MNEIVIIDPRKEGREDSFWYAGEVARYGEYRLVTVGVVAYRFNDNEWNDKLWDDEAREAAIDFGLFDSDIDQHVHWYNNNWFEIVDASWNTVSKNDIETWTEGIEILQEIADTGENK